LKAAILKRVARLEEQFGPAKPELPPIDFGLLIESEMDYFSKEMDVLRSRARELGYGDKNNTVSWFDLKGCDPVSNETVRVQCLAALNQDEGRIVETVSLLLEKCVRLTANLSAEEKQTVKKYNEVARFFSNSLMMDGAKNGWWPNHTKEELAELRSRYEEIMQRHGEVIYE
jgi:hypothetical protein